MAATDTDAVVSQPLGPPDEHPSHPARPDEGHHASTRPAGIVLAIGLVALIVAAALNADALVRDAEGKPFGTGRDAALSVWEPVRDVAHALQLHRPRQLVDDALGRRHGDEVLVLSDDARSTGGGPGPTGEAASERGGSTAPPPGADQSAPLNPGGSPEDLRPAERAEPGVTGDGQGTVEPVLRTPTAAAPLRVWIGGDSLVNDLGPALARRLADVEEVEADVDARVATGLTRPDYFDWPARFLDVATGADPEVMVVMLGANDAQGIVTPAGEVHQTGSAGWEAEYRRRVAGVMDLLADAEGDRLVLWIGLPPMRDAGFDERMGTQSRIYASEAASRPWVRFVSTAEALGDPAGRYAAVLPDAGGDLVDLRQGDGIHLSNAGADRVAGTIIDELAGVIDPAGGGAGAAGGGAGSDVDGGPAGPGVTGG